MLTRRFLAGAPLLIVLVGALGFPARFGEPNAPFDSDFEDKTMRVDYFHTGYATRELITLERVVSDGPWAGSRKQLLDEIDLGKYYFYVLDAESGRLIYSRGFASLFGEWQTTGEAESMWRTFHESLRFPWPKRPVRVVVKKRGSGGELQQFGEFAIDPAARWVNPAEPAPAGEVWTLFESGPPSEKVDIVVLGEGYRREELPKFHADARRLVEELFAHEPFKSRRGDFNVRAIDLPSAESGVTRPHAGLFRRTPVSAQYSIFDSERYLLTYDNRTLRDVLSAAPYDFMAILVNERQYGGGGIYNFQLASSVDSDFSDYVFVHEFGHHFAGLGDEYYTSDVAYETGAAEHPEPWEPNITALHNRAQLKWRDLVTPGTPIPTPWDKEAYESHAREIREWRRALIERAAPEAEFDQLFHEQRAVETKLLASMQYSGAVGAFEGASYEPRGLYRPEIDCIMFSRNEVGFCRVCRRAIERVIDLYAR